MYHIAHISFIVAKSELYSPNSVLRQGQCECARTSCITAESSANIRYGRTRLASRIRATKLNNLPCYCTRLHVLWTRMSCQDVCSVYTLLMCQQIYTIRSVNILRIYI